MVKKQLDGTLSGILFLKYANFKHPLNISQGATATQLVLEKIRAPTNCKFVSVTSLGILHIYKLFLILIDLNSTLNGLKVSID